jgi:UDP-N-acetylmuramyl pentapeptide phosphotransferase/UDP-N-acetylglucosamine-1-phosphate transferase
MAHIALLAFAGAAASLTVAALLVATARHHGRYSMDVPVGVQKFHLQPVPRIGGISIYLALWLALFGVEDPAARQILGTILVAGTPALAMGLLEDVTKRISIGARLAATASSGILACWIGATAIHSVDLPLVDALLRITPIAVLFTAFAVAGVANAINIIDGFNGLASGTTVIALTAIAIIALLAGDPALFLSAVLLAGCIGGFWLVNFPWGKLFLGDGGAYFAGFALAWLAVLLPARNPDVSPWASLLACGYPIIEVLYSVARRRLHRVPAGHADRAHLHSLVATRIVQPRTAHLPAVMQNSAVSVLMWLFAAVPAVAAVVFHSNTTVLISFALLSAVLYHWLYRSVTRP